MFTIIKAEYLTVDNKFDEPFIYFNFVIYGIMIIGGIGGIFSKIFSYNSKGIIGLYIYIVSIIVCMVLFLVSTFIFLDYYNYSKDMNLIEAAVYIYNLPNQRITLIYFNSNVIIFIFPLIAGFISLQDWKRTVKFLSDFTPIMEGSGELNDVYSMIESLPLLKKEENYTLILDSKVITIEDSLGKGAFGEVFSAKYKGERCAVKMIPRKNEVEGLDTMDETSRIISEISILSQVRSKFIVTFYGIFFDKKFVNIVMELLDSDLEKKNTSYK